MWSPLVLCLAVGLATAEYAWKPGTEYKYEISGRTLAALHQVSDKYVGVVSRAILSIQPKTPNTVYAKIYDAQYSQVHAALPGGWTSRIPEKETNFKPLPLSSKPFEIHFKNGVVDELVLSKNLPTAEVNLLKSVVSQLQVDTQGAYEIKQRTPSQVPKLDAQKSVYRTMEDTVTGECEVMYDVSPLPEYAIQSMPALAPVKSLRGDGHFYDIVKTKNFSNCEKRVAYHYGFSGLTDWEPADNRMDHFLSRSSVSRIVISGSLNKYTIQSSVTTARIILSPALYDAQKGMVGTRMNVTLVSARPASGSYPAIANSRTVKDLVYEYNTAFPSEHGPHTQTESSDESNSSSSNDSADSESDSQNSSSTSESSEENQGKRAVPKRFRRSAPKKKYDSSGSSSSSSEDDSEDSVSNGGSSSSSESSSSESSSDSSESRSGSGSSDSSSSSSSSEEHQPKPSMNKPPQVPLLPYFIGYQGSSVQAAKDLNVVSAVKKLCSQIAAELQNPSSMPQKGTLEKFSIVVRLVRTMSTEQLRKVTSEIYAPIKSSSGENPWPVLRDAVATAGTGPALIAAKEWIMTKKIYGEEAAEVLATLPRSARTPTPEYMDTFFTLSTSPDVTKQPFLNTTAILAFTNLVRKAQVNNVTAHNYYGVHAFGRFSPIDHKNISERYIPYLAKALRSAVKYGDSHSIQVYIRALGNLAHPKILSIYEPYLEGKEQMSTFQRTLMVASLNKLARTYPKVARRVLFNVYQNTAEAHEVRCAAVFVLMRTGPPAFMLQRMAEFTNKDISQQVSSAVKSAIQSAAALEGPHNQELKKNAAAAVHLLTPKHFGLEYSNSYLKSYMVKEMGLAHMQELSYIGSSDSFLPSSLFLNSRQNIGGWKTQHMALGIMTSSIDDIVDAVSDRFDDDSYSSSRGSHGTRGRTSSRSQSPFTADTIAEMLNAQPFESEQVEGNLLLHTMGTERFITFDNTTFNNIPHALKEAASALRSGHRFYYSKLYNRFALTLSFATETGLPFVYTLKCPTYMSIRGEVKAKTHPDIADGSHSQLKMPQTVNASASLHVVYSSRMAAKISFVAPLTHQRYIAGLDKNVQVNFPVHADFSLDAENARVNLTLEPLYNSRDSLLFHYSTWPYTTKHNILDINPVSQGNDHKIIHVREPHKWENTFGKDATGFAFRVKYLTEQKYVDTKWLWEKAHSYDALSFLLYPSTEYTIKYNEVNVYFDAHKSSSKSVTFTADYSNNTYHHGESYSDESYEEDNSASNERQDDRKSHSGARTSSSMASPSTSAPISEKRQKEFLEKASSGIQNSSTSVLDLAVVFNGEKYVSYVATAAYANSEVDEKSRFLFYYHKSPQYSQPKPFEVCLAYEGKWPKVPLMNYAKALKAKPTSYSSFEIAFGETCRSSASQISIKGKAEQTSERKEYLRRSPLSQLCMSQMQHGDYLLPACRNVTAHANFLDSYSYEIEYDKLPAAFKNYTYKAYSLARYFAFPYLDEKIIDVHNKDGKVTIDLYFDEDLHAANVSLSAPYLDAKFNRVRVSPMFRPIAVQHPTYSATKRFLNVYSGLNYPATCSIESKYLSTFDNTTYAAHLGKCWHVIMSTKPTESYSSSTSNSQDNVAILARDVSDKKKEFKIVLGDNVFEIKPAGSSGSGDSSESAEAAAYVLYNQKPHPVSYRKVSQIKDDYGQSYAQWWALPSGPVIFVAPKHGVYIYYNGYGAKIMASSYHKNDVYGLCGTYTGEPSTDFTSPRNCILRYPDEFVASYALPDETCQGDAKEMQRRAASAPCFRETATPYEVISEEDYSTGHRSNSGSKYNSNSREETSSTGCTQLRTKIIEEGSRTCFSMRPLPACANNCRPAGKVEQRVPVHCVANSDASRHYVQMVKKGANPDFGRKEVTKEVTTSLPKSCKPE